MTNRVDGPLKVTGRARYGMDHNLPGMVRAILATLYPAKRRANIHRTHGAVTASTSNRCNRRPHCACTGFGCGPASTSRYPYGGRPP